MSQRIRNPKLKSAKTSGAIQGLLHSLQCARLLLDRANHTLCDIEDTGSIRERMATTLKDLAFLTRRLKIEYRFLKWREDKVSRGEWRGELEIASNSHQDETLSVMDAGAVSELPAKRLPVSAPEYSKILMGFDVWWEHYGKDDSEILTKYGIAREVWMVLHGFPHVETQNTEANSAAEPTASQQAPQPSGVMIDSSAHRAEGDPVSKEGGK
jgi:hypothetical protein